MDLEQGLYGLPRKLLLGDDSGAHSLSKGQEVGYAIAACLFVCGSGIASGVWGFSIARKVLSASGVASNAMWCSTCGMELTSAAWILHVVAGLTLGLMSLDK
jgi:hypothetical protein